MNEADLITKKLHIGYKTYSNARLHCFHKWCYLNASRHGLDLAEMVASAPLKNWYFDNWQVHVVSAFLSENAEYLLADIDAPETFIELFFGYPQVLNDIYPKPILNDIKKQLK